MVLDAEERELKASGLAAELGCIIDEMNAHPLANTRQAIDPLEHTQRLLRIAAKDATFSISGRSLVLALDVIKSYDALNGLAGEQALTPRVQSIHAKIDEAEFVGGAAIGDIASAGNSPGSGGR